MGWAQGQLRCLAMVMAGASPGCADAKARGSAAYPARAGVVRAWGTDPRQGPGPRGRPHRRSHTPCPRRRPRPRPGYPQSRAPVPPIRIPPGNEKGIRVSKFRPNREIRPRVATNRELEIGDTLRGSTACTILGWIHAALSPSTRIPAPTSSRIGQIKFRDGNSVPSGEKDRLQLLL